MITVVTVVRNDLEGLTRTARSVAGQSLAPEAFIIKDGGSTDGTTQYARQLTLWSRPHTQIICGPDSGIYHAMNVALAATSTPYVLFLNAGDEFASHAVVADIQRYLEGSPTDIVFGDSVFHFPDGSLRQRSARPSAYIWYGQPALHQSTVFRTALHQRYPYPRDYPIAADYAALAAMMVAGASTHTHPLCISRFQVHPNSASFSGQARARQDMARVQREILGCTKAYITYSRLRRFAANQGMRAMTFVRT